MAPCGPHGCILDPKSTVLACEAKCNATTGCFGYVFAPATCSGVSGPICWLKSSAAPATPGATCRDSRIMGGPAVLQPDIPSRWASEVSASTTPLVAYPRPQMVRGTGAASALREKGDANVWTNLNGLWEWEPSDGSGPPPFGRSLSSSILVPFPVESCLSGVAPSASKDIIKSMWYRLAFDASRGSAGAGGRTLLHFGAVDWQAAVYLNGVWLGNHTGGYDGFSFEVSLEPTGNELIVYVYDPSDSGAQPNGKQRISAIDRPGGDTYTPSSGIWQTVWLEAVPQSYVSGLKINQHSLSAVEVSAAVSGGSSAAGKLRFEVMKAGGKVVATAAGEAGASVQIQIPMPTLWSPSSPYLYNLKVSLDSGDSVTSYFGLRTFVLGDGPGGNATARRPLLNGNFTFLAGFLDQSWWPDGQYTAPTDEALASDVAAVPKFGLNMIRLHQKVNPERWYYHADRLGVVVFQDMVQKYGGATAATVPLFVEDFKAMVRGRGNHPSIVQFTTFNEGDCWEAFEKAGPPNNVAGIVNLSRSLDPYRLVDTDSGGGANDKHIGDVNDIHTYPYPGDTKPSATQYGMIGEFGGIGAFVEGKEWKPRACSTYLHVALPADEKDTYVKMAATIAGEADHVSASVYTQTTDVELECDGFLNYDRSDKFSKEGIAEIKKANEAIIEAGHKAGVYRQLRIRLSR